jgi:hypothetical protein
VSNEVKISLVCILGMANEPKPKADCQRDGERNIESSEISIWSAASDAAVKRETDAMGRGKPTEQ